MQNILKRLNALLYETSLTKTELQQNKKIIMIYKTEENELLKEILASKLHSSLCAVPLTLTSKMFEINEREGGC